MPKKTKKETNSKDPAMRFVKGRVAEALIQELFKQLDFTVFPFGMESTHREMMPYLKNQKSDIAVEVRNKPDFVVCDNRTGDMHFIEVKYRKNGCFTRSELDEQYPYKAALLVIVSPRHIKCLSFEELEEGKEISAKSRNYLAKRKEFELDREVIKKFCAFAVQFFQGVD